mgnify:FL=1
MFSKEESRQLRALFWTSFGKSFPRKWILYNTKIKGLSFKFYFDNKKAYVTLDVEDDLEQRISCWENLESLKSILQNEYLPEAIFNESFFLENGKEISRIYIPLSQKVSKKKKNSWQEVMAFFNVKMDIFESFFNEYKDIINPKA